MTKWGSFWDERMDGWAVICLGWGLIKFGVGEVAYTWRIVEIMMTSCLSTPAFNFDQMSCLINIEMRFSDDETQDYAPTFQFRTRV